MRYNSGHMRCYLGTKRYKLDRRAVIQGAGGLVTLVEEGKQVTAVSPDLSLFYLSVCNAQLQSSL